MKTRLIIDGTLARRRKVSAREAELIAADRAQHEFERLHHWGARLWEGQWLAVNNHIVTVARGMGVASHKEKLFLTRMAWEVCAAAHRARRRA